MSSHISAQSVKQKEATAAKIMGGDIRAERAFQKIGTAVPDIGPRKQQEGVKKLV